MTLTSLFDFAGRGGNGGTLLIVTGIGLFISLLFLLVIRAILGENLDEIFTLSVKCYELKSLGLDKRTTLVLSNTRKLNRVPSTK